mgnify:CR=1 FL=1
MKTITIDHDKCTLCLNCTTVCPPQILHKGQNDRITIHHRERCVSCGHCAAVCPAGAITSHPENSRLPFVVQPLPEDTPPEHSPFLSKRSIRAYKEQPMDKETIERLIEYGERAPSGHNFRHREYYAVTDATLIDRLEDDVLSTFRPLTKIINPLLLGLIGLFSKSTKKELTELKDSFSNLFEERAMGKMPIFRKAPCVICIAAPTKSTTSLEDCTIAQTYMMLYGETIGVGSCIIGYAQYAHKKIEKRLAVPKGYSIFAVTIFGYPRFTYRNTIEYPGKPVIHWC